MRKKLLRYLKESFLEHITTFAGVVGQFAAYIQAFKIFHLRSSYAVSLISTLIGFFSTCCWLIYGLAKGIKPLIISSIIGVIGIALVIIGILYYK
jgi:CRISPR-associated Cas5-like protein